MLLDEVDVIVDCTPKKIAAENIERYRRAGIKFILQGGRKTCRHGSLIQRRNNYTSALGRQSTRVVSRNTTATLRTLSTLKRAGLLKKVHGSVRKSPSPT